MTIIAVDASRNRSGGSKSHLIGILSEDPRTLGVTKVHLWAYPELCDSVPDSPWLIKHAPKVLTKSLLCQLYWQKMILPLEINRAGCNIVLNTDAGTVCSFMPSVTISQDMLSFEPGVMHKYWPSKAWLRLLALKYVQKRSLKKSSDRIFLTQYAADIITKTTGTLDYMVIPHGIDDKFIQIGLNREKQSKKNNTLRLLYVSNTAMYKHQWNVVKAVGILQGLGFNITLSLVGGGSGKAQRLLDKALREVDPEGIFIDQFPFVEHNKIPIHLQQSDVFIFASSCENMPITLIEAMASKLPIACSDRGPMPEILMNAGVYFDPENVVTIVRALNQLLSDDKLRDKLAEKSFELAKKFSWKRCSKEVFSYLLSVYYRSQR